MPQQTFLSKAALTLAAASLAGMSSLGLFVSLAWIPIQHDALQLLPGPSSSQSGSTVARGHNGVHLSQHSGISAQWAGLLS